MHDAPVDPVQVVEIPQREPTGALGEMHLRRLGLFIAEGGDDDAWHMRELSVDLEDSSGGEELRLHTVRGRSEREERSRERHKEGLTFLRTCDKYNE